MDQVGQRCRCGLKLELPGVKHVVQHNVGGGGAEGRDIPTVAGTAVGVVAKAA